MSTINTYTSTSFSPFLKDTCSEGEYCQNLIPSQNVTTEIFIATNNFEKWKDENKN